MVSRGLTGSHCWPSRAASPNIDGKARQFAQEVAMADRGTVDNGANVVPLGQNSFDLAVAKTLLQDVFAPWVQDLGLSVEHIEPAAPGREPGAVLRMAFSERLCRESGVMCGQALMSFADMAMVFAVSARAAATGR
jgi:hypothetical protein